MTEPLLPDPSARLNAAYRVIAGRMDGLNFVNPSVQVEAVALRAVAIALAWRDGDAVVHQPDAAPARRLGMDLVPQGKTLRYHFPAGDYEFISSHDEAVGEYQMCSLISPLLDFADHATAREVAELARDALLDPANAPIPETADEDSGPGARWHGSRSRRDAPMSKRDFLRGRFLREDSDAARG